MCLPNEHWVLMVYKPHWPHISMYSSPMPHGCLGFLKQCLCYVQILTLSQSGVWVLNRMISTISVFVNQRDNISLKDRATTGLLLMNQCLSLSFLTLYRLIWERLRSNREERWVFGSWFWVIKFLSVYCFLLSQLTSEPEAPGSIITLSSSSLLITLLTQY